MQECQNCGQTPAFVTVFPNPAQNHITFTKTSESILELLITDVLGRRVISYQSEGEQSSVTVDISDLKEGYYFAQLRATDTLTIAKFTVQR